MRQVHAPRRSPGVDRFPPVRGQVRPGQPIGRQPAPVFGQVAAHRVEVALADQPRDRADRAVADGAMVDLDHRAHLDAGPAQEDLVTDVELGAIDRADLDRDPGILRQLDDRLAGDALEDVVGHRRRQEHAVANHEQIRRRRLGGVTAGREHQRLVEAVELGLRLLERHVHVAAHDLAARRQRLVGVAAPGRGHDPDALLDVDVVPERRGDHVQLVVEVVQPDADRARALVVRRADVDVLAERVPPRRLDHDRDQLVDRRQVLHQQHLRGVPDALHVLPDEQAVQLALLLVPVAADALERRRPVHERVGHDADLGVAERDPVALEVGDQVVERPCLGGRRLFGRRGGRLLGEHRLRSTSRAARGRVIAFVGRS